jgi:hypothetical protein
MGVLVINSKKYGIYQVLFDDNDEALIKNYTWHIFKRKNCRLTYCTATAVVNGVKKSVFMHRIILKTSLLIDHINGNGIDNRRSNLRAVTPMQNQQNAYSRRSTESGFKGVSIKKYRTASYFCARIRVNRKLILLGSYPTAKKAALAYNEAASRYFGEFANLNRV